MGITKGLIAGTGLVLFLTGCSTQLYYKQGAPVKTTERDELACDVNARKKAPVQMETRIEPGERLPARRVCDSAGNCRVIPGQYLPPRVYSVDVNESLRARVKKQCMADRGYSRIELPNCSDSIARSTPKRQTTRMPKLTKRSCVIHYKGGAWQIVTAS